MGPAVLREKGLYDSDHDSLRVAWKPRWEEGAVSLRLLFIQLPSPGSDNCIAGEKRPGPPPWAPAEAQMVAHLSLRREMLSRSPLLPAWQHPPPVDFTWGHPDMLEPTLPGHPQKLEPQQNLAGGGPEEANLADG